MRDNFFKIVRCDKATTDDYDKANKWARNKIDVLASKEIRTAIEDHDMSMGDFCGWCKGNGCEMCDNDVNNYYAVKYGNSWQEYEWLDEWLDNDNAYLFYADDDYKPMIKIGDKI